MPCTEAYREHIILSTAIARPLYALRLSTHGVTGAGGGKKKYPDGYFEAPYEEYPVTICGQTVILINGEIAAALLSLPERKREIIFLYFFGDYTQQEIGKMYGRCRSMTGYQIRRTLKLLQRKMEVLSHGESEAFAL